MFEDPYGASGGGAWMMSRGRGLLEWGPGGVSLQVIHWKWSREGGALVGVPWSGLVAGGTLKYSSGGIPQRRPV
jgi:hypothetical protein